MPFDYLREAEVTRSEDFHSDLVASHVFKKALQTAINAAQDLDRIKKALFYGRTYLFALPGPVLPDCEKIRWNFNNPDEGRDAIHAILGIFTEAGELLQQLQSVIEDNNPPDYTNLKEEIGDLFWYSAILADMMKVSFDEIQRANIAKLRVRYPDKFSEADANHRNLEKERRKLENCFSLGSK